MTVTEEEITTLCKLSRIAIAKEDLDSYTKQINLILKLVSIKKRPKAPPLSLNTCTHAHGITMYLF